MSDDTTDTTTAETPVTTSEAKESQQNEAKVPEKLFGLPMAAFVRGGSSTFANDKRVAEMKADAERRRAIADQEKALARKPIEQGGAKLLTNNLTENSSVDQAYVELQFLNKRGEPWYEFGEAVKCLADVVMLSATELALIIACPSCKARGLPLDQCQIRIRQSNKHWELDTSKAGELILWTEGQNPDGSKIIKPYRSAGVVRESEKFRCDCGWSARISMNKIVQES